MPRIQGARGPFGVLDLHGSKSLNIGVVSKVTLAPPTLFTPAGHLTQAQTS